MPNEISETAQKWACEAYNHEGIRLNKIAAAVHIGKCIQAAIDEAMQQRINYQSVSEIARKWARWFLTGTFSEDERPLSFAIQSAIDEATAQQTDPLPVMEEAAEWLEDIQSDGWDSKAIWSRLLDTIAQIRRERGLTDAAEHMRKLKKEG